MLEDSNDPSKWKSRKFRLTLLTILLITMGFLAVKEFESLEPLYPQYVAGLLGALTVYLGGNIGNKFVVSRKEEVVVVELDEPEVEEEEDGAYYE